MARALWPPVGYARQAADRPQPVGMPVLRGKRVFPVTRSPTGTQPQLPRVVGIPLCGATMSGMSDRAGATMPLVVVCADRNERGWMFTVPMLDIDETIVIGGFKNLRDQALRLIAAHSRRPGGEYRVEVELSAKAREATKPPMRRKAIKPPMREPQKARPTVGRGNRNPSKQAAATEREKLHATQKALAALRAAAQGAGVLGPVTTEPTGIRRDQLAAVRAKILALQKQLERIKSPAANQLRRDTQALALLVQEHLQPGSVSTLVPRTGTPRPPAPTAAQRGWPDVAVDLTLQLADLWSNDIRLVTAGAPSLPSTVHVDRVVDTKSFCVGWTVVPTAAAADELLGAGWFLWRPERPIEVKQWRRRTAPDEAAVAGYLVATLRDSDVRQFSALLSDSLERLRLDPANVAVRSGGCSPDEHRRRMIAAEILERRSHRQYTDDGRPILGYCENCGQPLTDPVSAARGYGPICKPRDERASIPRNVPAAAADATIYRIAGIPASVWRETVRQAARSAAGNLK